MRESKMGIAGSKDASWGGVGCRARNDSPTSNWDGISSSSLYSLSCVTQDGVGRALFGATEDAGGGVIRFHLRIGMDFRGVYDMEGPL